MSFLARLRAASSSSRMRGGVPWCGRREEGRKGGREGTTHTPNKRTLRTLGLTNDSWEGVVM